MYFRTLASIFEDLDKATKWFESVGIQTHNTRLQAIGHYLFDQLTYPDPAATLEPADHTWLMNDAVAFGLIASEFAKLPAAHLPRKTLRDALYGPLVPSTEDRSSSDARNKFFELELAATLSSAGTKIVGFDDVQIEYEGSRFVIECKRPFIDHKFEDNLSKAYQQLSKKLKNPTDRGFVAICLEKMLDIDGSIQGIDSTATARFFSKSLMDGLTQRLIANGTTTDIRIVAILYIMRFQMNTKTRGTNAMNYFMGSVPIRYTGLDSSLETSRVLKLTDQVQQKFQSLDTGFE